MHIKKGILNWMPFLIILFYYLKKIIIANTFTFPPIQEQHFEVKCFSLEI